MNSFTISLALKILKHTINVYAVCLTFFLLLMFKKVTEFDLLLAILQVHAFEKAFNN